MKQIIQEYSSQSPFGCTYALVKEGAAFNVYRQITAHEYQKYKSEYETRIESLKKGDCKYLLISSGIKEKETAISIIRQFHCAAEKISRAFFVAQKQ